MINKVNEKHQEKYDKLLKLFNGNKDQLVTAMINFKINDLKKCIRNIEIDLNHFEFKYQTTSSAFYKEFLEGKKTDENDDYLIWSGEYETIIKYQNELEELL